MTCVPTGVKHLHAAAHHYDIGVYFEANGHGTVLFSEKCIKTLQSASAEKGEASDAVSTLLAFSQLINQSVGDALSDMLMVEAVLAQKNWGAVEWDEAYEDLPNKLLKVEVADRNIYVAEDAERKLASPPGLQTKIDAEVSKVKAGRSFVRPSGTEDCVRVYAEAATPEDSECELRLKATIVDVSPCKQSRSTRARSERAVDTVRSWYRHTFSSHDEGNSIDETMHSFSSLS